MLLYYVQYYCTGKLQKVLTRLIYGKNIAHKSFIFTMWPYRSKYAYGVRDIKRQMVVFAYYL